MRVETLKLYKGKVISLEEVTGNLAEMGYSSSLQTEEEGEFKRTGEVLDVFCVSFEFPVRIEWDWDKIKRIRSFDPANFLFFQEHDILIILPLFKRKPSGAKIYESSPLQGNLDLKKGDYVVHINQGIGRYLGRKKIDTPQGKKSFLEIEYRNKEKLFILPEKSDFIQKYVNLGRRPPKLSRLGGKEWNYIKDRARKSIQRYALILVREQALRKIMGGFKFSEDTAWQKDFESSFPYPETEGQAKALLDLKKDMESDKAADRLICGDVGYGKTEVAMRGCFKSVMDSKQVAFLVPTTILAEQHYQNLIKRTEKFPVRVEMLSRFRTKSEQRRIVEDIKAGTVDIVIGTHRLLSEDVKFKNLGFLVIDEEQRFGVKHKDRIRKMKTGIDVLSLTATPIPRTLYMGLTGIKDISIIKTPPKERLAVKTYVGGFNPDLIKTAVVNEVKREGQVFFIENRIKGLVKLFNCFKKILPDNIRIEIAHGRMPPLRLEKVMLDFINKRVDCLLSTAIVESGIDIASANTLIVNDAHRFGLADLHQLRGRVGRFNRQAYAYFFFPKGKPLSKDSENRLKALKEYSYLGAGFNLAMRDLELRGAGNILGEQQHGFVWQIGLDLYSRLLRIEIDKLKFELKVDSS